MNGLVLSSGSIQIPMLVSHAGARVGMRFMEFFTTNISRPNTRQSYPRDTQEFLTCARSYE